MFAGIDVGGRRKGFHLAGLHSDGTIELKQAPDPASAAAVIERWQPTAIAIDSPRTPAPPGRRSRAGEQELARSVCQIRYTPDESTIRARADRYYEWIEHGFELYAALATHSVIECFPTASWTRWEGLRGGEARGRWSTRALARHGLALPRLLNQDQRDAVGAALTARVWSEGRTESFGDIVVPLPSLGRLRAELEERISIIGGHADVWAVLADGRLLAEAVAALAAPFRDSGVTCVAGIESRGFALGTAVAAHLGVGFVAIRKETGMLPGPKATRETGPDYRGQTHMLRLQRERLVAGDQVLLVDDWAETGMQAMAAKELIEELGARFAGLSVLVGQLDAAVARRLGRYEAIVEASSLRWDR